MSPETLNSNQEQKVASVSADFQPFMRNVLSIATRENVKNGLVAKWESHVARGIVHAILSASGSQRDNAIVRVAEHTIRYYLPDRTYAWGVNEINAITVLQQKYAFPLTLEDLNRAVDFNYFVKRVINECRKCQEIDISDIFLIREEAEELKEKCEKETGLKPRWYRNAPEIFEMAARLERYGLVLPLDSQFTFNTKAWVRSLRKHSPEKADLLLKAARQMGFNFTGEDDDMAQPKPETEIRRMQPEDVDKLTYLHSDIAAFIKTVLIFRKPELTDQPNPLPPNLERDLVSDALGNITLYLIGKTNIQEQFRILEEVVRAKYGLDGGEPLLQFLIKEFKLPLSEEALERIRQYYKDHPDRLSSV